ncbi:hypothetical protein DFP73DRAFT_591578 [Morchella snyderi]|nr:hypothetical protein DFP73DRAFT_591578 [Morchella snyderi]
MSFRPSGHGIRLLGSITIVLTVSTTVFFILYSASTISARSILSSSCTAAAAFDITTCILLLIFTIFPPSKRLYLLGGVVSTALAVVLSTLALGWMSFRPKAMPNTMFGRDRDPMVIAGFSLFVVSLVFQAMFWTLQAFNCPRLSGGAERLESASETVIEKPVDFPSHNFSSSTTLGDNSHNPFVLRPTPTHSKLHNPTVLYVIQTPPITGLGAEVDPFDTWDTSDVCATQRAACTLAAIEYEQNTDATIGLGIFTPADIAIADCKTAGIEVEMEEVLGAVRIHPPVIERQSSPPIPDYDMTPRSASFPGNVFREHISMMRMSRTPTLVISPTGDSREFDEGSGRLVNVRGSQSEFRTGNLLVRSQTVV